MQWPRLPSTGLLTGGAIALGAAFIFSLDISPLQGGADGGAYALLVALAAFSGRRAVLASAGLGVILTLAALFFGAETGQPLIQIVAGRLFGLGIITLVAAVLLRLMRVHSETAASDRELAAHQEAISQISKLALTADRPLIERLQIITERTAAELNAERACVGEPTGDGEGQRFYDVWDRRTAIHRATQSPPTSFRDEYRAVLDHDLVLTVPDVRRSALHRGALDFYAERQIVSVLHTAAAYRGAVVASLIVSSAQPRVWTAREIAFAKAVAQIVALILALDGSERTLARLDHVSQGLFVVDKDGAVIYANAAARMLAKAAADGAPPPLPFSLAPLAAERDLSHLQLDGRDIEVARAGLPDGEILVRVEDVTARNVAQDEARRLEVQLKESAKLQAMGQMAAGVAHDFNNILAAILGFTQSLIRSMAAHGGETTAGERALAERVLGVCKRGKALTDEILGFARTASVERSAIDLAELLGPGLDVVPSEGEHPAEVTVIAPQGALPVIGNAAQLLQLLQNLVVNAMHASQGGTITVSAGRADRASLLALRDHSEPQGERRAQALGERLVGGIEPGRDYCFLRVADTGHGIAPEVLDRIFEPFFTTKGRSKGSGLGLVVVHGVVDSHHGCCHVRSAPGQGTVFTIYLPMLSEAAIAAA